ncbi:MAG: phosphohistidine phosphatase SixA [Gammaproteobacteria bacterium]|jgi:phosphohistidine phosphatase
MKLYLVQHGEAVAKDIDPERPLTEKGRKDVERLAGFLGKAGIGVGRVIHSGKLRARQTAEALASSIAPGIGIETSGLINPNDNPAAFDWQSDSWDEDILVVGHLPFMARLVAHLLTGDPDGVVIGYQPGTMVCLEHSDGRWQIDWMLRPELLA